MATRALFDSGPSFKQGAWAADVKSRLKALRLVPGPPTWVPRYRIWRGTGHQWVQFEREDWSGPFFWSGKPACRASDEAMFVGYYVERGLSSAPSAEYVLSPGWHWHGFYRCIARQGPRSELNELLLSLPAPRRVIWLHGSSVEEQGKQLVGSYDHVLPYVGLETLDTAKAIIDKTGANQWINVMLASVFPRAECVSRQADIVSEFRNPVVRANEMRHLCESQA